MHTFWGLAYTQTVSFGIPKSPPTLALDVGLRMRPFWCSSMVFAVTWWLKSCLKQKFVINFCFSFSFLTCISRYKQLIIYNFSTRVLMSYTSSLSYLFSYFIKLIVAICYEKLKWRQHNCKFSAVYKTKRNTFVQMGSKQYKYSATD